MLFTGDSRVWAEDGDGAVDDSGRFSAVASSPQEEVQLTSQGEPADGWTARTRADGAGTVFLTRRHRLENFPTPRATRLRPLRGAPPASASCTRRR